MLPLEETAESHDTTILHPTSVGASCCQHQDQLIPIAPMPPDAEDVGLTEISRLRDRLGPPNPRRINEPIVVSLVDLLPHDRVSRHLERTRQR